MQAETLLATEGNGAEATEKSSGPKLNALNFLNVLFYIINVGITYGLLSAPNRENISQKYQTLVTPFDFSFAIWSVIFAFQGIWAVLQLFPAFRAHPYVQKGVSYWYIGVCTVQSGWSITFMFDLIWESLIFMSLIGVTLAGCVIGCYYQYPAANKNLIEFWFLLFPFAIEFGWILCASLVNANIVVVWTKAPAVTQITVAICSLALIYAYTVWALFVPTRPNYSVPAAISWAALGVYFQLGEPIPLISDTFDSTTILSIRYSAGVICLLVLLLIIIRVTVALYKNCIVKKMENDSNVNSEIAPIPAGEETSPFTSDEHVL